jgi:5-methylcytosine-specific restriction endonuclease McrA
MDILEELGYVPCYVCGNHVQERQATLEHVIPRSKGGLLLRDNLSISHPKCNTRRGSKNIEPKGIIPTKRLNR